MEKNKQKKHPTFNSFVYNVKKMRLKETEDQKSHIVRAERKAGIWIYVLLPIPKRECQSFPQKCLGDISRVVSLLISPWLCLCVGVFPFTQSRHAVAWHGA